MVEIRLSHVNGSINTHKIENELLIYILWGVYKALFTSSGFVHTWMRKRIIQYLIVRMSLREFQLASGQRHGYLRHKTYSVHPGGLSQ
jgi:hypothetical protein